MPPSHPFFNPPPGGWAPSDVRDALPITGGDLIDALGLKPGPIVGWLIRNLAEQVTAGEVAAERDALLTRAEELAEQWPGEPRHRFRIRGHAIQRFRERVRPDMTETQAQREMVALAHDAPFSRHPPEFTGLRRAKVRGGYLIVSDDVCFAVADGVIRTVLTRQLADAQPAREDPFPDAGVEREDPSWPDRRYRADQDGVIECRTVLDGELLVARGRTTFNALMAMKRLLSEMNRADDYVSGAQAHRQRRQERP